MQNIEWHVRCFRCRDLEENDRGLLVKDIILSLHLERLNNTNQDSFLGRDLIKLNSILKVFCSCGYPGSVAAVPLLQNRP
jgi:hypothetical protein